MAHDGNERGPAAAAGAGQSTAAPATPTAAAPGRRTAVPPLDSAAMRARAAAGVSGAGQPLPFLAQIQQQFGRHDVSGVTAHVGGEAAAAAGDLGAEAYASDDQIAFAREPDLHTAAHEAAHVVQQRGGVQLKDNIGRAGDAYERHADAVADRVVAGQSAEDLLDEMAGGGAATRRSAPGDAPVQKREDPAPAAAPDPAADAAPSGVAAPVGGINRPGFIDNSEGANIRTAPLELGGTALTPAPMPPTTRVFVSGTHPDAPQWWYVTAFLPGGMVRGYVQNFRVTIDLPEPAAKLYQIQEGDTVEALAVREFSAAVQPGRDLRYYENVLLAVNRDRQRNGIRGSFQDPNILGGGANNIQLVAGQRIWLVSAAYALSLEGVVPSGSLTGGVVANARAALRHLDDILSSVTQAPNHFGTVAGEYADAIRAHLPEIIGITLAFITAEAASAFLAATPTGVGQLAAVLIQLALAAFGAAAAIEAAGQALQHGQRWLQLAWTANGNADQIANASQEFLRMLVAVAMAALAALGVRSNISRGMRIADAVHIDMPGMAMAVTPDGTRMPVFTPGAITSEGAVVAQPNLMAATGAGGARAGAHTELPFPRRTLRGVQLSWLRRNKPRGWREVPTRDHEGWIWLDTAGRERLRFMRPNGRNPSGSQWARQANGYFRWQDEAGRYLDIDGRVVASNHPQFHELTHIMYEGIP